MTELRLDCGCRYSRADGVNEFAPCPREGRDPLTASAVESSLENLADQLEVTFAVLDAKFFEGAVL